MGEAGRHNAPSPQSSVRRSWTRSFGSQHAAHPEGPQLTRSSDEGSATHPATREEKTVRARFDFSFFKYVNLSSNKIWHRRLSKGLWPDLVYLGCNTLYRVFKLRVASVRIYRTRTQIHPMVCTSESNSAPRPVSCVFERCASAA